MNQQIPLIAGVDEAGRGPLAGPVVAAAVILDPMQPIEGLADSKSISEAKRLRLAEEIKKRALCFAIARADIEEIDRLNILHATMLAMKRAIEMLTIQPQLALIDGNRCPDIACEARAIIKGDVTEAAISAASILAKVTRDNEMIQMAQQYPGYEFAKHKGYPTKLHIACLEELGPCEIHRLTFAPVRRVMAAMAE